MADKKDNQGGDTDDLKKENQTVTIKQFEELKTENAEVKKTLEDLKKTQSGSDRTNTELRNLLKLKDNEKKTNEQKNTDALAELAARLNKSDAATEHAENKNLATQMLNDAGLPIPRTFDRLIGKNEEETIKFVQDHIEDNKDADADAKDKTAKKFSRVVDVTKQKSIDKMSYQDMVKLSKEQFDKLPPEAVTKAMNAALGEK